MVVQLPRRCPFVMSVLLVLLLLTTSCSCLRRLDDICTHHSSRRLYLDLGETGVLTAFNVTSGSANRQQSSGRFYNNVTSHEQCVVEIVTCPSCVINVVFRHIDLNHHCGGGNLLIDSPCRCDYVWISEPPHEDVSGVPFCGVSTTDNSVSYKSRTRTINIALLFSETHRHAFTLEYTAERNRQYLVGSPGSLFSVANTSSGGVITSPFFPSPYPRDLGVEYIISCAMDPQVQMPSSVSSTPGSPGKYDPSCRVRLIFSDFQVASASVVEFFDGNNQRLDVTSGSAFRPPVILSTGSSLSVRFYANGGSGLGFKALYSFVTGSGNYFEKSVTPSTDCGGFVENFGGAITMMNMVERGVKSYDCVWLIRPPENFLHLKTHLYLKVATFGDFAGSTELQIRQGLTSELPLLETLLYPISQMHQQRPKEHIISVSSGFYVSLRGSFGPASRLAISYASFSYNKCFAGSEFLCQNHRCIPGKLSCDGFDHCGDNSDEPASCYQEWEMEPVDRRWYSHTPNYYFPKMERYPDLKTATLVFVASSLGLIMLISALIVLLYRMGTRARQQRELQTRLQTISELLDGARIEEIITPDDPPDYEAPPDYDEVIKVRSSPEKKKRKKVTSSRSRSSPGGRRNINTPIPSLLEVVLPHETPRTRARNLTVPDEQPDSLTSHVSNISYISQVFQASAVPESPPPPYSNEETFSFQSTARVASESNLVALAATEGLADAAVRRQTWQTFPEDSLDQQSEVRVRTPEEEPRSLRRGRPRQRRSQSCCTRLGSSDVAAPVELEAAIENQLQDLITSCSSLLNASPTMSSQTTEAESYYLSSLEIEPSLARPEFVVSNDWQANFQTNTETISVGSTVDDDKYWEEFDKQFQNPNRKLEGSLQRRQKVADLSKRYDCNQQDVEVVNTDKLRRVESKTQHGTEPPQESTCIHSFVEERRRRVRRWPEVARLVVERQQRVNQEETSKRKAKRAPDTPALKRCQKKREESVLRVPVECGCAGACGCATARHTQPVRKRRKLRREDRSGSWENSSGEWSSGSTVENFLDEDEI